MFEIEYLKSTSVGVRVGYACLAIATENVAVSDATRDLDHVIPSEHTLCCQTHFSLALPLAARLDVPGIVVHTGL